MTVFRIGILQCDHVSENFRPDFDDYSEMFMDLLSRVDGKLAFDVYPVIDDIFPGDTSECDAWVITGSRHSSYDDLPWINKLATLITQLHVEKRKVVGICFGHQLIAHTLGGETRKSDKGWGVGVHSWEVNVNSEWMDEMRESFSLLVSHQDQVEILPTGARLIASSDFCEYAAFQIENHILTFQGHPEFPKKYSHELMLSRTDRIPHDQLKKGMASLVNDPEPHQVANWMVRFMKDSGQV